MKKKVLMIVSLMVLGALAVVSAQSPVQIGPYGNLKIGSYGNLKIGPYGNLVGITGTQGKDVLSQIREGFEIAYRVKNPKGHSEVRLVYAIGDQPGQGLTIQGKKSTESSMVVTTQDKTLEIASQFIFDEKAQELIIDRTVRNTAAETVDLQMMREYIDPELIIHGQPKAKQLDLVQLTLGRVKAGRRDRPIDDCLPRKCPPPPPPCLQVFCPGENGYVPSQLIAAESRGNQITLQWKEGTTSASNPRDDASIQPSKEVRFVVRVKLQ